MYTRNGRSGSAGGSLLHQVEPVPISAEVLHLARGQLEPGTQLPVLEKYVRVSQARGVEILPLSLLGQDPLDALDEADLFQDPNFAVTGRNRDAISLARSEEHTSELQSRVDLVCRL